MTKIQMPEPVVEFRVDQMGIDHDHLFTDEITHLDAGHHKAITTDQAEAYADARVLEALEDAVQICWEMQSKPEYGKDDKDRWLAIAEQRIRALIPKEPPCDTC